MYNVSRFAWIVNRLRPVIGTEPITYMRYNANVRPVRRT